MAGFDKICEITGEHAGWQMAHYKRNLVQVLPNQRSLFRGQAHTLFIMKPELYYELEGGCIMTANTAYDTLKKIGKQYFLVYPDGFSQPVKLCYQYNYCLHVPGVQGNVEGEFWNDTFDLSATKRKLKRLLRAKTLNISHYPSDLFAFNKNDIVTTNSIANIPFNLKTLQRG